MKYVVRYREIIGKNFIVEAEDEYEARKKAIYTFDSGGIDLNKTDRIDQFIIECYPSCGVERMPMLEDCLRPIDEVS